MWPLLYLGPTEYLVVDKGTGYTSRDSKESSAAHGIYLAEAPVETLGAIGTGGKYHDSLRLAFERIRAGPEREISKQNFLDIVALVTDCNISAEGLCFSLPVFGAAPRAERLTTTRMQLETACPIEISIREIEQKQASRKIAFGLWHKGNMNGPK